MYVNRKLWTKNNFEEDRFPAWPCPYCGSASLKHDKEAFRFRTDKGTRREDCPPEDWLPEFETYRVVTILNCTQCNDNTLVIGTGLNQFNTYIDANGNGIDENTKEYEPKYFIPSLKILDLPTEITEKISESRILVEIEKAFSLFYCDNESCANKIGNAVEA